MNHYDTIRRLAAKNGLSHAYLIVGESEAERNRLTLFLSEAMNCENGANPPCGVCRSCQKIASRSHPDILYITRRQDKREIVVDQIRELSRECFIVPNEGRRKVFVLPEADSMNQNAQNALLKLLEEPPAYAAFLLEGANPGSFLPTIRSRCVTLKVGGASGTETDSQAEALADAFVSGNALAFTGQCFRLEKADKDRFDALLTQLYAAAVRRSVSGNAAALLLAETTEKLREMRACNVSAGHCLGLLMSVAPLK